MTLGKDGQSGIWSEDKVRRKCGYDLNRVSATLGYTKFSRSTWGNDTLFLVCTESLSGVGDN